MKHSIFCYILSLLVMACNQNNKTPVERDITGAAIDSNLLGVPVTNVEMEDDSVFDDGSRPTSWEVAGITKVYALKIFIKDLQYMAATDNREEISKLIRYPLNATIKTQADFLANYEKLFNPTLKEALARVNPRQVFRNYKGVMLGNGNIWIQQLDDEFKIIAINN
jgi:hypothetical protein